MPVANAVFSNWMQSMITLPAVAPAYWETIPRMVVTSEFKATRSVEMSNDTTVRKGQPWGHVWEVGNSVWQIDFNSPFLIYLPGDVSVTPLSGLQIFPYFISQCLRVLPSLNAGGEPLGPLFDPVGGTFQDLWETPIDVIVKSVSLTVNEDQASVSVSLLSTTDPRTNFYQVSPTSVETWGARVCKPYDLKIPVSGMVSGETKNCIGGPMNIAEVAYQYPVLTPNWDATSELQTGALDGSHISLVRGFELKVEADVMQFQSVGMPSSRPLLGVRAVKCNGSIDYVPLARGTAGVTMMPSLPQGWVPDMQSMEYVRNGGQLYVAGQTSGNLTAPPLWVGLALDTATPGAGGTGAAGELAGSPISLFDPSLLGPVMVASYNSSTRGGEPIGIKVDFQTNVGVATWPPTY